MTETKQTARPVVPLVLATVPCEPCGVGVGAYCVAGCRAICGPRYTAYLEAVRSRSRR